MLSYILIYTISPLTQVTYPRLLIDTTGEQLLLLKKQNKYPNIPTFRLKCSIFTVF